MRLSVVWAIRVRVGCARWVLLVHSGPRGLTPACIGFARFIRLAWVHSMRVGVHGFIRLRLESRGRA